MERLRNRYLNITLDAVLHPVSSAVDRATREQKFQASRAQPVKQKELTANEWFEKGFKLNDDSEEEIRCYTRAIRLKPDYAEAYYNRAQVWKQKANHYLAISAYQKYLDLGGGLRDGDQKEVEGFISELKKKIK